MSYSHEVEDCNHIIKHYECDKCGTVGPESWPWIFEEDDIHYCTDCAYLTGRLTEQELLDISCFHDAYYIVVTPEQELLFWRGAYPEHHPKHQPREEYDHPMANTGLKEKVLEKCGYKCEDCGTDKNLTVDHIIPMAEGGSNDLENLRILCQSCNSQKGSKMPGDYYAT